MSRPQCDSAAYGQHERGSYYYIVIKPNGVYRCYCDSDCVEQHLRAEQERVAREVAAELGESPW
jgi:hypothetical protein